MSKAKVHDAGGGKGGIVALALPVLASLAAIGAGWFATGLMMPAEAPAPVATEATPPSAEAVHAPAAAEAAGHGKAAADTHGKKKSEGGHGGESGGGDAEPVATPIGEVVDLPAIVVNLAPPSKIWARIELSAVFTETPDVEARRQLHQDILAFVETVTPAQLQGPSGLRHLREDIADIARVRSDGKARGVLFKTLIFE